MRIGRNVLVMAAGILVAGAEDARATDLRGEIKIRNSYKDDAFSAPPGESVTLYSHTQGQWRRAKTVYTNEEGRYRLQDISPGTYAIQVGGRNFQLQVRDEALQDIPRLTIER